MPQPNFVPCRPAFSRIAQRSGVVGSASSVTFLPLRTNDVDMEPLRGESPNLAPGVRGSVTDRVPLRLHNPAKILNNAANRAGRPWLPGSGWVCSIPSTEFNAHETEFFLARSLGVARNGTPRTRRARQPLRASGRRASDGDSLAGLLPILGARRSRLRRDELRVRVRGARRQAGRGRGAGLRLRSSALPRDVRRSADDVAGYASVVRRALSVREVHA